MVDVVTTWAGRDYLMGDLGFVGDTSWETEWPFGCTTASWTVTMPRNFSVVNATRIGADVQIFDGPILTWGGYLSEVEPAAEQWTFHAKGYYALAENYLATTTGKVPTSIPSVAVSRAITDGWNVTAATTLPATPLSETDQTVEFNTVRALLDELAASTGRRWKVNEARQLILANDPTTPRWHLDNGDALLSAADDDYLTAIFARYVTAESAGEASAWGVATAVNPVVGNLRREEPLDLTPLGLTTNATAAAADAANRLALAGQRRGFISGLEIAYGDLTTLGGAPVRLGQVKAGEMLRAYTVADAAGVVQVGATQDIVIGRTAYTDGSDTLQVVPVGLTPRQLSTILAAPQKPPEPFTATAA